MTRIYARVTALILSLTIVFSSVCALAKEERTTKKTEEKVVKKEEVRDFRKEIEAQMAEFESWSNDLRARMGEFDKIQKEMFKGLFDSNFFVGDFANFPKIVQDHEKTKGFILNNSSLGEGKNGENAAKQSVNLTQKEDEKFLYYQIDFSGFNKDQIGVTVKNNHVTFSAIKSEIEKEEDVKNEGEEELNNKAKAGANKDKSNRGEKNLAAKDHKVADAKNKVVEGENVKRESYFSSSFYYSFMIPRNVEADKYEVLKEEKKIVVKFRKK